jgi:hypothetical protein
MEIEELKAKVDAAMQEAKVSFSGALTFSHDLCIS